MDRVQCSNYGCVSVWQLAMPCWKSTFGFYPNNHPVTNPQPSAFPSTRASTSGGKHTRVPESVRVTLVVEGLSGTALHKDTLMDFGAPCTLPLFIGVLVFCATGRNTKELLHSLSEAVWVSCCCDLHAVVFEDQRCCWVLLRNNMLFFFSSLLFSLILTVFAFKQSAVHWKALITRLYRPCVVGIFTGKSQNICSI